MVALSLLGEPLGAILLAWIFLYESIGIQQLIGMTILLIALSLPSIQHLQSMKFSPNEN
jgi:drug/metabolite transporter (DMT)-like permease